MTGSESERDRRLAFAIPAGPDPDVADMECSISPTRMSVRC